MEGFSLNGSGQQLKAYRPEDKHLKRQLIQWMNSPIVWNAETYGRDHNTWNDFRQFLDDKKEAICQPAAVEPTMGTVTWEWPGLSACRCKPMQIFTFQRGSELFTNGSHMPIIVFVGNAADKDRSKPAKAKRDTGAKYRKDKDGYGWDKQSRDKRDWDNQWCDGWAAASYNNWWWSSRG